MTLAVLALANVVLLSLGVVRSTSSDSDGPALILVAAWLLFALGAWVLVKAGLHTREVTFVVDGKKAEIRPSSRQRKLDRRLRLVARIAFWISLKGGQWATWLPCVRWSEVKSIKVDPKKRQILLRGGAWDVRLICTAENFADLQAATKRLAPRASRG